MNPPPTKSRWNLDTPFSRLLLLGLLLFLLMIPASMIEGVVNERQARRDEATADIISKWGGTQTITGPILRVPFITRSTSLNDKGVAVETLHYDAAYFLPRRLGVSGQAITERRKRGLFEVPVYVGKLQLDGEFDRPDFSSWDVRPDDIDWKRAELMVMVAEPRALHADVSLSWAGKAVRLLPSTGQAGSWSPPGVHAPLGNQLKGGFSADSLGFSIALSLNGANGLYFSPTAEETRVKLSANWPHPSFQGGWLPAGREISDQAFSADWSVSYLGRDYPQRWRDSTPMAEAVGKASFGVGFDEPVDQYSMAQRITKYAVMALLFTFAVIWLTEVLSGARVHPIQYAFTGGALCLFGLLQLSFAEHFGFGVAFLVASVAVVGLVTLYSRSMLHSLWRALGVGSVLMALYGYLYLILLAEDYALLGGSLALFAGLAATMWLTRKVNWFSEPEQALVA